VSAVSTELQVHPLVRDLFPPMDDAAFEAFVADIKAHEQREPIVMFEDAILDGYHRYRACRRLGIEPTFTVYTGDDPVSYVISINLRRRHLDESQRAVVAAKLATLRQGARTDLSPIGEMSQAQAADLLNVGKRSVERAREVLDHGSPELVQAVERGDVSVSAAAEVASLPEDEQREVLAGGDKAVQAKAKELREERAAEHAAAREWEEVDDDDEPDADEADAAEGTPDDESADYDVGLSDAEVEDTEAHNAQTRALADQRAANWRSWSRYFFQDHMKRIRKTHLNKEGEVRALHMLERDVVEELISAAERGEAVSAIALRDKLQDEAQQLAEQFIGIDIERARHLFRVLKRGFTRDAFVWALEEKFEPYEDGDEADADETSETESAA
jgi:hypothetical protein